MWPDNETVEDLIGFRVHADLIRSVVTSARMLPTTIGIFGDWGGGKTSIMKMLQRDLDPETWPQDSVERHERQAVAVVYVNTWLFEGYDDAKAAILSSVLTELASHKRFGAKVRDRAYSLLKSVNLMRLTRLALKNVALPAAAAFFTGGAAAIPAAVAVSLGLSSIFKGAPQTPEGGEEKEGDVWEGLIKQSAAEAESLDIRGFRERFSSMLKDGGIDFLVVLVDDLDRCTPERIIENLEAVKLFLSADNTAFVIGADRRIVEHAIRDKYAQRAISLDDKEQAERLVKDYLEKLVQIPYALPRLSASEIQTYMTLLFCKRHLSMIDFEKCLAACEADRSKNRYGTFGFAAVRAALGGVELKADLAEALSFAGGASALIADGLKGNPRQVKRFLNALLLRKQLANVAKLENIRDAVLVKLMILEYSMPDLFSQLFVWQSQQNGFPKELAELERMLAGTNGSVNDEAGARSVDPKWATTGARRWVAMEPALASTDLRDYFWVARDRLESTFSGMALVPPIVRSVLDGLVSGAAPKRNAAMQSAKSLSADERVMLLTALDQRISRQPSEQVGYSALLSLTEAGIVEALEKLVAILLDRPLDPVPAPVGMQVMTLFNTKPELRTILGPIKDHLLGSSSTVGKAAQSGKQGRS